MEQPSRAFTVTHKSVFAIAVPTTLAYLSTPLLGLVDTGVVGRLGDPAFLGGLAVGAIIFDIIFTTFNFLRASTTGLVAQALGAGQTEEQRIVLVRSLLLSLVLGFGVLLLAPFILNIGLWAMDAPDTVEQATIAYFTIRILAAPLTLINYSVLGWILGLGQAWLGLILQLVLNGTNVVLSIAFGLYLGWGIEGVAWATVFAEGLAVLVGLIIAWQRLSGAGPVSRRSIFDRAALAKLVGVNFDIMIRSFCLLLAFAFFTAQGAKFGEVTLAANAVLMNFFLIAGYFLDGFATAAEQLTGRAVGARHKPAFDTTVRLTLVWGFGLAICASAAFWFGGPLVIDLLTTNVVVREEARIYLIWAALTALIGVLAFQMDGVFIGATWTSDMRNMMLLSLAAFWLTWWLASPIWGNHGLWLSLEVFLGMRGLSLLARLPVRSRQTFARV
ncbi:MAG: MATE family efflux transporter [Hyphomicrobiales bacterium]|nr:MATE family efflux transporter [Hyphomicrobiales bacterium]